MYGGDIAVSNPPLGEGGRLRSRLCLAGRPQATSLLLHFRRQPLEMPNNLSARRHSLFHIIDPKTGKALTGRRSVTVVAANGVDSDALALR
jgi:hypothetical protein